MTAKIRFPYTLISIVLLLIQTGCSELNDAPPEVIAENLTYTNDMKEIFDQNCISCHSGTTPQANYDMATYAGVITKATAGDPNSLLVTVSVEGGSMHGYYNIDLEIDKVVQWVVEDNLAE